MYGSRREEPSAVNSLERESFQPIFNSKDNFSNVKAPTMDKTFSNEGTRQLMSSSEQAIASELRKMAQMHRLRMSNELS
jgi:hypothetical protein